MRIGVVSFHASHNYGSVLQAFSFEHFLKINLKNDSIETINFRTERQKKLYDFSFKNRSWKVKLLNLFYYRTLKTKYILFERFINNELNLSKEFSNEHDFDSKKYDILISGGDQIWNPACDDFSWLYYFDGVKGTKVSYAPSFGPHPTVTDETKQRIKAALEEYRIIGVREIGSKKFLEEKIGLNKEIQVLPDPVLLLSAQQWSSLLNLKENSNKGYILFYTLYCSKDTYKYVKKIGDFLGKKIIITKPISKLDFFGYYNNNFATGPKEFLELLNNADLIVSTSFHACVFSAIFHKSFIALDCENDNRIQGFLNLFKLKNHNFSTKTNKLDEFNFEDLRSDYDFFDNKIIEEREKAILWCNKIKEFERDVK